MSVKVGTVVEGSVASVKKFGAYVTLEGGEEGFIHISKVAREYVKNIEDYLKVGQKVEAKVLGTTKDGKWELSIKDLKSKGSDEGPSNQDFEKKLAKFMRDSGEKISAFKRRLDKKRGIRKRP
ncbi:MAG TPA: S1 RNA-binding domain-containing protein [Mesotoga sp.]|uniref:S1 motif domain-containing protein n=1 Tax=Mesotoga infera TaxID=1236046 RepID=A0A7Z7LCV5_9BACT|nr:S1 RNA-binding domain-containing protein [Mesotoga infera]MBP7201103.1 S1 RNA-binding domain-containing protein [Mesotoga sp.]MDI9375135.1 S1 RNA-binding domain-containing protein [Thermotogota bacterium]NLI05934.1 S1 RNA-binding domain-containing protein [Thermotogaceae bacterium]MDD4040521.1 S1 RNA-binding domain-containing protein [Mesotoga sp.]MDD5744875.1 S1 RNA-binding domain-containing protein [Mesotoga sp.]